MKQTILGLLLLSCPTLFAQGLFESSSAEEPDQVENSGIEFSGYVRGSVYGGSPDYDFSTAFGETALRGKLFYNKAFLYTDMRLRAGTQFNLEYDRFELKEAYAGYSGAKLDVLLGNQIVTWGRTDGFNPTNNITPNDYFFLSSEPDDQKMSNLLLRVKYRIIPQIDLDVVAIPLYKPSVYRYDLFAMPANASFTDPTLPGKSFENMSLAARLNFELSKVGFSLSWFRGYDPFHGFNVDTVIFSSAGADVTNSPTPYLKNTLGADLAVPVGSWIFRAEGAFNTTKDYGGEIYIPNPDVQYVAGIEKSFFGFTTIAQYIGKYTLDFSELVVPVLTDAQNPMAQMQYGTEMAFYNSAIFNRKIFHQQEEYNHAVSLTINKSFAYDAWKVEFTIYYDITSEEYLIRPKISWKITDALTASAGYSYMAGPDESLFDYSGKVMNGGFAELKVNF
jgi:hypothetical protein